MAARNIAQTDTLETFRTQFNALAADDFGDIGTLDASLSATSVIGAVNEINSVVTAAAGWFIEDSTAAQQAVGSGQTLTALGTANQTTAVVSAPDTLTVGLANDVTIPNDLTVTGDITNVGGSITNVGGSITAVGNLSGANIIGTGNTHTLGTVQISGNTINSTDSTQMIVDDSLKVVGPIVAGVTTINPAGSNNIESSSGFSVFGASIQLSAGYKLYFGGDTANSYFTEIEVVDPTAARTIIFPDTSGTVVLDGATAYATSSIFTTTSTLNIYNSAGVLQKTIVGSAT
jgi:hypothetical protein